MKKLRNRAAALLSAFVFCASMAAVPVTAAETAPLLGDANSDGTVNTLDAARILYYAALVGIGPYIPEDFGVDSRVSDVTEDGRINARDAAAILCYAAASGTGYTGTFEEYMKEEQPQ